MQLTPNRQKTLFWTGIITGVTSLALYFCYKYFSRGRASIPKTIITRAHDLTLNTPLEVVHKTDKILVINKPYDVRIDGDFDITISKMIQKQFPEYFKIGKLRFPHQLDFATSGILCVAFDKKAAASISKCFAERTAKKDYLALVFGHIPVDKFTIDEPVGEDKTDERGFRMCIDKVNGRKSITHGEVLIRGKYNDQLVTKVLLKPTTGRRHQLRVHMKHFGYPIVGDYTYAKDDKNPRMMLHAWKLNLPIFDKTLETKDPFSSDL